MAKERCDRCESFKEEVSAPLFDIGKYDGICLRRRTDTHVKKNGRCDRFIERMDSEKEVERHQGNGQ